MIPFYVFPEKLFLSFKKILEENVAVGWGVSEKLVEEIDTASSGRKSQWGSEAW
jgi:hypothetical protein